MRLCMSDCASWRSGTQSMPRTQGPATGKLTSFETSAEELRAAGLVIVTASLYRCADVTDSKGGTP